MKNTLLLLIFLWILPFFLYSQITFNDLLKIDSEEAFQKLCIEQGFEENIYHLYTQYAFLPDETFEVAEIWGTFSWNEFYFIFPLDDSHLGFDGVYDRITRDIKANCRYFKTDERGSYNITYYYLPGESFRGYIGFWKYQGKGHIHSRTSLSY